MSTEKQPLLQTSDRHPGPAYDSPSAQAAATSGAGNEPRPKKGLQPPMATTLDAADRSRENPQEVNQFERPVSNLAPDHAHERPIGNGYQSSPYPSAQPQPSSQHVHYGAIGGSIQVGEHTQQLQVRLLL